MQNFRLHRLIAPIAGALSLVFSATTPQAQDSSSMTFAGPATLSEVLIPATLESFARDVGLSVRREIIGNGAFSMLLVDPANQSTLMRFDIRTATSTDAITALADGRIDVALSLRQATEDEVATLINAAPLTLARDGLVAVVHPENPLGAIGPEQLKDILAGKITDWADLGVEAGPIRVHRLEPGTDQDLAVRAILTGDTPRGGSIKLHLSGGEISDAVSQSPLSIGIARYSETGNAKPLGLSGACGIVTNPTSLSIKNEDYPYSDQVMAYHRASGLPVSGQAFLQYLNGRAAQGPVRLAGFVDQLAQTQPLTQQGDRLANAISVVGLQSPASELRRLVDQLRDQSRLSMTFRFLPKSSELDFASKANVRALASSVMEGDFQGRTLTVVGFTDGVGSSEQNLRIGLSRAKAVEAALTEIIKGTHSQTTAIQSASFGEAMPIACDDTEWGRDANRRVEIWVK